MRIFWMILLLPCAVLAEPVEPWRVIASLTGNWSDTAFIDRVVLVEVEDERLGPVLDLIVYAENPDTYEFDEVARIHDVAWQGRMWGTHATMIETEAGSIEIQSMNEAIGRNRWHETLTIAYRDGAFRVAGLYNDSYDTLDLEAGGGCSLNFLTGEGEIFDSKWETTPFTHSIPALELSYWNASEAYAECRKYMPERLD